MALTMFQLLIVGLCVVMVASDSYPPIEKCPGEGPRYGDFKCNHDRTHRVCAKLVDNSDGKCEELSWNEDQQTFWQITGQERWNWKTKICNGPNPGDSWCICMWATANLIRSVGCEHVHINCGATDIPYIMRSVSDGGWDLSEARQCMREKCPEYTSLIDTGATTEEPPERSGKSCSCQWTTKKGTKMGEKIPNLPKMDLLKAKLECEDNMDCKAVTCNKKKQCWLNAASTGTTGHKKFTSHVMMC